MATCMCMYTCICLSMYFYFSQPSNSESLVLMVSYKQKPFQQAQFPQSSEGQKLTEKVCQHATFAYHARVFVSLCVCLSLHVSGCR